ncbi:MAG: hypothetical protein KAW12_16565 [Candidatus Aminicenantes bacterium]|nr:hypothetical protein [Candidatus Aminicenantes bacterium]
MRGARSLKDLLKIREENRKKIDKIQGIKGTALGRKNETGKPAILVFVPRKIKEKWLPNEKKIPKRLEIPHDIYCPTDVIDCSAVSFDPDKSARVLNIDTNGSPAIIEAPYLHGLRDLNHEAKYSLLDRLRGNSDKISPGSRLAFYDEYWNNISGTLACFAMNKTGCFGFITNKHVGIFEENEIRFPENDGKLLGIVKSNLGTILEQDRFPAILKSSKGTFQVDAGFVELYNKINIKNDIDLRLPILDKNNQIQMQPLGPPFKLDLNTMEPIGKKVIGVGQMRSYQEGKIFAFAYQMTPTLEESIDYLIIGTEDDEFSDPGDSGKLIVTADGNYQPLAILWGGDYERFRHDKRQENWSYATDINLVLDKLELSIVRS